MLSDRSYFPLTYKIIISKYTNSIKISTLRKKHICLTFSTLQSLLKAYLFLWRFFFHEKSICSLFLRRAIQKVSLSSWTFSHEERRSRRSRRLYFLRTYFVLVVNVTESWSVFCFFGNPMNFIFFETLRNLPFDQWCWSFLLAYVCLKIKGILYWLCHFIQPVVKLFDFELLVLAEWWSDYLFHFMKANYNVVAIEQILLWILFRYFLESIIHILINAYKFVSECSVFISQTIPQSLILRNLLISFGVGAGDEIIPKLIDSLHEFAHLPISLFQICLAFADQLPDSG